MNVKSKRLDACMISFDVREKNDSSECFQKNDELFEASVYFRTVARKLLEASNDSLRKMPRGWRDLTIYFKNTHMFRRIWARLNLDDETARDI
jgi:hypothetical protein